MGTIIGTIVAAVATAAAGIICIKTSKNRQRREAEKDVRAEEERVEAEKKEIRDAIHRKDDAAVNAAVTRLLAALALGAAVWGCASEKPNVVYVAADRRIVSITNEYGVACKAVPDVVFAEMTDALVELKEIRKEREVDKRMGK